MAEVTTTLNGRTYRLECGDGEEEHLLSLSYMVGDRLDGLKKQFGQVGDDRLLLMAALMIADAPHMWHAAIEAVGRHESTVFSG